MKNFKVNDIVVPIRDRKLKDDNINYMKEDGIILGEIYVVADFKKRYSYSNESSIIVEGKKKNGSKIGLYNHLSTNFVKIGEL